MPSSRASSVSSTEGSITSLFPSSLASAAEGLNPILRNVIQGKHIAIQVMVGGENVAIPYRIHHEGREQSRYQLTELQSVMYSCIMTRHHDGHVRQRQLKQIITVSQPWVVPFVIQLAGEYVVEILDTCEDHLVMLDPVLYGNFIRDNPAYFRTQQDRMISYWDCYYRHLYKHRQDYVGFRLFGHFCELAKGRI